MMARSLMLSQPELAAENAANEASGGIVGDELFHPFPGVSDGSLTLGGAHGARVRRPDVGAGDVVAVAVDEPVEGEESDSNGEVGLDFAEVPGGAGQGLGIARAAARQSDRLLVQSGVLGGGEPLALVPRRRS